jgi:hypothetical protein
VDVSLLFPKNWKRLFAFSLMFQAGDHQPHFGTPRARLTKESLLRA